MPILRLLLAYNPPKPRSFRTKTELAWTHRELARPEKKGEIEVRQQILT